MSPVANFLNLEYFKIDIFVSGRFNLNDVAVVNAVMAKTWTVLASSLTLQKERKARQECEAMLQIARNLFTHLGASSDCIQHALEIKVYSMFP